MSEFESRGRPARLRQVARAALGTAARCEERLDDAVFQRMERHHHQPAAGLEDPLRRGEAVGKLRQLVIDEQAQRLERAGGRMNVAGPSVHDAGHDVGERPGGHDRPFSARRHDRAGDGAGAALLAQQENDVGEIALAAFRDHVGGAWAGGAHAHVERAVEAERKAAFGRIELHGGNAEVEHDAVGRFDPEVAHNAIEAGEFAAHQCQPPGGSLDLGLRRGDRGGVAVDTDDRGVRRREDRRRIAAGAEGAVDIDAAVLGSELRDDRIAEHGDVARRPACHVRSPAVAARHCRNSCEFFARAPRPSGLRAPGPGAAGLPGRRGRSVAPPLSAMANPV